MTQKLAAVLEYIGEARSIIIYYLKGESDLDDLAMAEQYLARAYQIVDELLRMSRGG